MPIRAFVSYAHENDDHVDLVERVAKILAAQGIAVFLDSWRKQRRNDWNELTTTELENSDYIVAIASPGFRAAAEGRVPRGSRRALRHEIAVMRELMQEDRDLWFHRIIPLVLAPWTTHDIPRFLQPITGTHVIAHGVSERGLRELINLLNEPRTKRARVDMDPPWSDPPSAWHGRCVDHEPRDAAFLSLNSRRAIP